MKRISPAVVKITTNSSTGSGVIYEVDSGSGAALILTNRHVIEDATRISVVVSDIATYDATLLGLDEDVDLAVLRICCNRGFSSAQLVESGEVAIGDRVYALGYPLGANSIRVTEGIVSASEYSAAYNAHIIQTDAAINPGNSGGPLIRSDGMVVGINTAKEEQSESGRPVEGTGYAIAARTVLTRLSGLEQGTVTVLPTPTVRPNPTPRATPRSGGSFRQFQIESGELVHEDDGKIVTRRVLSDARNFWISADFEVPYSSSLGDWNFGFLFRNPSFNNLSYVVLTQAGRYEHYSRADGNSHRVNSGHVIDIGLNVGSVNNVLLVVIEERGWLFVNSTFVTDLDLSDSLSQGQLSVATGVFTDSKIPGYSTRFSNLNVQELGLLSGPDSGELTKGSTSIATQDAEVDTAMAYVKADFSVPVNTNAWSSGILFRTKGKSDYLLFAVTNAQFWTLQHATVSGDDWQELKGDYSSAINFNDPIQNRLELFFIDDVAIAYANDVLLGTADIRAVDMSGDVQIAYGVLANDLRSTAEFENFEVWGSPYD